MSPHQTAEEIVLRYVSVFKNTAFIGEMTEEVCDAIQAASNAELERRRERVAGLEAALRAAHRDIAELELGEGPEFNGRFAMKRIDDALSGGTAALDAAIAEATRELQQRIEQLEAENHNWKMRANYEPCPNCAATEGMGFISKDGMLALQCVHCDHRGPDVSNANWTKDTDRQAVKAWNDEFRQRQAEMRAELTATREERDALAAALNRVVDLITNNVACDPTSEAEIRAAAGSPSAILATRDARVRAEGKREGLEEAVAIVENWKCSDFEPVHTDEIAAELRKLAAQAGEVANAD